jgi:hypothetical protein
MNTLMLTLALVLARAADDLAPGDRIEITFHSGATLAGTVTAPPPRSDPGAVTLDVTWEYPGLNGTMTVAKKEIRSIRRLRVLDDKTKQQLAEMKKRIAEDPAQAPAPKPAPAPEPPPKPEPVPDDQAKKEAEELQRAREFYATFPAPDWSEERRNAIRLKKFRGQVPTPAEREFEAGFELWKKGRGASEKKTTPQ